VVPITAFVIVAEMTADRGLLIPLMATATIAFGASRLVCREPVYHALAHGFLGRPESAGRVAPAES
jgi:H+/Cl- antiporter ClcA